MSTLSMILIASNDEKKLIPLCMCAEQLQLSVVIAHTIAEIHILVTQKKIDIFIVDRNLIGQGSFSIQNHLIEVGYSAPVLVFNDRSINENQLNKYKQNEFYPFLCEFEHIIKTQTASLCITKNIPHIRPQTRLLMELFLENVGKAVSIEVISQHLWGNHTINRTNTIYTYIYELRKIFENSELGTKLIKISKGAYTLLRTNKTIQETSKNISF